MERAAPWSSGKVSGEWLGRGLVRIPPAALFWNFFFVIFFQVFSRKKFYIQIDEICRENAKKRKKLRFLMVSIEK